MFPGTFGGQARPATPVSPGPKPAKKPPAVGRLWGNDFDKLQWLDGSGSPANGQFTPIDSNVASNRYLFPGGSDGRFHYLLAVDDTGEQQLWVDKFAADGVTLLDRWEVTGVKYSSLGADYLNLFFYDAQYVSASKTRVVALMDQWDSSVVDPITGGDGHNLIVTVFDTAGTLLAQHTVYTTTSDGMGSWDEGALTSDGGSFCDGVNVYFWHGYINATDGNDVEVAKVNLSTGALTSLFTRLSVGDASPGADSTWIDAKGLVAVDDTGSGDLICVADNIARVKQDGTPVWFTANPDSGDVPFYGALARSGRGSVWASGPSEDYASASPIAHEFTYEGVYKQASAWSPEPVHHAWLTNY